MLYNYFIQVFVCNYKLCTIRYENISTVRKLKIIINRFNDDFSSYRLKS